MSFYASYIRERTHKEILETEHGFLIYSPFQEGLYIEEIYVHPDFRKTGVASQMADQVVKLAKEKNLSILYGSVCPAAKGSNESLKVLLAYGFRLDSSANNFILFRKDL